MGKGLTLPLDAAKGAESNKFLPGRVPRRTIQVRTREWTWIGGKLAAWGYNSGTAGKDRAVRQSICTEVSMVNESSPAFCPHCGAAVNLPSGFCGACGQPLQSPAPPAPAAQPQYPQPQNPQSMPGAAPQSPAVMCPFCHSTQVQAGKRGWKWYAGYVGSGNAVWTCQSCGKTF